jgi:hypothetical protein
MLFKTILAATTLVGTALAGFDIRTGQTEALVSDAAEVCYRSSVLSIDINIKLQSTSIANALSKAINSYEAAIETQSDVKSAVGAFYTYARTRDGIPEIVTATGTEYTRYTTLPDW